MDREQQVTFAENAEQRQRANLARWRESAVYQAAMSKHDDAGEPERAVKRA